MALCPKCKTDTAKRVHREGILDRIAHAAGFSPYQCGECQLRFKNFRFSPQPEIPRADRGTAREIKRTRRQLQLTRIKQEIYLYTFAGMVFLAFLYFLSRERG